MLKCVSTLSQPSILRPYRLLLFHSGPREGAGEAPQSVRRHTQDPRGGDALPHRHGEHRAEPARGAQLQGPGVPAGAAGDAHAPPGRDHGDR